MSFPWNAEDSADVVDVPVNFLIIGDGVFSKDSRSITLCPSGVYDDCLTERRQIFKVVFGVAPTREVPVSVRDEDRWGVHAVFRRFVAG